MISTRAFGKLSRRWVIQAVQVTDPDITSPAALVLLAKKYFCLDKSIYTEFRMTKIRNKWMKLQMRTPDFEGGLTCQICGRPGLLPFTTDKNKLATLDHIIELKEGGKWNDSTNFRVACYGCNTRRNSMGNRQAHLKSKYYSNVVILSRNGLPLSTVSTKKAKWYLLRNLASEVIPPPAPYPRAIQLNFAHKAESDPSPCDLLVSEDKCVMCGATTMLSLHHVVPHVIRRHFPPEHKDHAREWCVLLCTKCHQFVEEVTQPLYKKQFPQQKKNKDNINFSLQVIKAKGNIRKIPREKLNMFLNQSDYKSVDDIPDRQTISRKEHHQILSNTHLKSIEVWANDFIVKHGGIEGVKKYFSEIFLSLNPKYVPEGYLPVKENA